MQEKQGPKSDVTLKEGWGAPRHLDQMSVFNELAGSGGHVARGGGSQLVRYQGRTYKVRIEKGTRSRYVLVKKKKVYLKDIRGRYRRAS